MSDHNAIPPRALQRWNSPLLPRNPLEILAITAGVGNGWRFSPQVLRESLPLWDGVESFVDHALSPRSVRDLAGICSRSALG